ncbi:MAG TPA: TetR family transcriptional regulator C-terminal domain-containing protein [Gemmatimonadaceae bacterium]|nr:TetR family transcriptional regulator C-terminal domain-containing protein [Gemmatimonadaceae bacterium]
MRDRRTQIVEAASTLMSRQGFLQTSVDDVIKQAGLCGKAHFYHYFKSKEELGYAVLNYQFERFTERGLAILQEPRIAPLDRLNRFIDAVVANHAAHGCQSGGPCCGNLATEMADSHEGFRERIEVVFERWAAQIQALLWEARPQLDEQVDVPQLARFIIATLEGALLMSRVKREIDVMEGIAAELKRFVASRTVATRVPDGLGAPEYAQHSRV